MARVNGIGDVSLLTSTRMPARRTAERSATASADVRRPQRQNPSGRASASSLPDHSSAQHPLEGRRRLSRGISEVAYDSDGSIRKVVRRRSTRRPCRHRPSSVCDQSAACCPAVAYPFPHADARMPRDAMPCEKFHVRIAPSWGGDKSEPVEFPIRIKVCAACCGKAHRPVGVRERIRAGSRARMGAVT